MEQQIGLKEKVKNLTELELKILHAARDEFERVGYHETKVETIAKKVDIGKATIYRHFGNKADLFFYVLALSAFERFSNLEKYCSIEDPYEALNFVVTESVKAIEGMLAKKLKNSLMTQAFLIQDVNEAMLVQMEEIKTEMRDVVTDIVSGCLRKSNLNDEGARSISDYITTTLGAYMHIHSANWKGDRKLLNMELQSIKKYIFRGVGMSERDIERLISKHS